MFEKVNMGRRHPLDLMPGTEVLVQDPSTKLFQDKGQVIQKYPNSGSYDIQLEDGRVIRRNAQFLRVLVRREPLIQDSGPVVSEQPDKNRKTGTDDGESSPVSALRRSPRLATRRLSWEV